MKDYILNKDQTDFKIVDNKTDFNKKFYRKIYFR